MGKRNTNEQVVHVGYLGSTTPISVGRLVLKSRFIHFEYSAEFLKLGLQISPFKLPLKGGVIQCSDPVFEGLFRVFNDSLPDGWGRLLLNRKIKLSGQNPGALTPLDLLCYVGKSGMGAITYEPENVGNGEINRNVDLDLIARECAQIQADDEAYFEELLALNGSSAGARPKALVQISEMNDAFWFIKFRGPTYPKDIGAIEFAYHEMAREAELDVPKAQLFTTKKHLGYFGVERFDRSNYPVAKICKKDGCQ